MSIIIKGMEMPKSCGDCPCLSETYCCCMDGVYPYDCNILIQETEEGSEFIGRLSNCPLVEAPKWIPVAERLPEKYVRVLVYSKATRMGRGIDFINADGNWYSTQKVSHWMPLPQPPESEGE